MSVFKIDASLLLPFPALPRPTTTRVSYSLLLYLFSTSSSVLGFISRLYLYCACNLDSPIKSFHHRDLGKWSHIVPSPTWRLCPKECMSYRPLILRAPQLFGKYPVCQQFHGVGGFICWLVDIMPHQSRLQPQLRQILSYAHPQVWES